MAEIQKEYRYFLLIDGLVLTNDETTTPVQVGKESKSAVTYDGQTLKLSLCGISFNRKVYEPGHIQAELFAEVSEYPLLDIEWVWSLFKKRPVSLLVQEYNCEVSETGERGEAQYDKEYYLAQNYFINEVSPQFDSAVHHIRETSVDDMGIETVTREEDVPYTPSFYVMLDIYSPDKLMTVNKFSRAHLGRTLFSDILQDSFAEFKLQYSVSGGAKSKDFEYVMTRDITRKLTNLGYGTDHTEFIHPYLVQYNETFHDFLCRVANRCGEVFYFEDGNLCVGLKDGEGTPLEGASRIIFQRQAGDPISVTDYALDSVKESVNGTYKPADGKIMSDPIDYDKYGHPTGAYPDSLYAYNSELAAEDQYMILYKDKFARDSWGQLYWGDNGAAHAMSIVSDILQSTSLVDTLASAAQKFGETTVKSLIKMNEDNKSGNETVDKLKLNSTDDYAVLFSKVDDSTSHWITVSYTADIKNGELDQMRQMVCIDMGTLLKTVKLGDKITLPNDKNNTYVVVQIDVDSGYTWQRDYDAFSGGGTLRAGKEHSPSQRIYAIPIKRNVDAQGNLLSVKFYPPVLPVRPFRKCGPQPAFVLENKDPIGQGRVRIRYPWQPSLRSLEDNIKTYQKSYDDTVTPYEDATKVFQAMVDEIVDDPDSTDGDQTGNKLDSVSEDDYKTAKDDYNKKRKAYLKAKNQLDEAKAKHTIEEAATPWIRMSTPMATAGGGGVYFKPEKGDEVMVDYENGNIERPYVVGTLYSKNVPAPDEGSRVIVSKNGHTIKMSDPDDASLLLTSLYPGLKMLTSYGVKMNIDSPGNQALGGIELSDQLGFYNIKMSSHERKVSISSSFGEVSIDALTGISIEAPNGDISIKGKNVSIEAFNKIEVVSGKNIKIGQGNRFQRIYNQFSDVKELGRDLGKHLASGTYGKFFDFSILRAILEVFIRPIDGTFEIKSNRYLLLEAGKGAAMAASPTLYDENWAKMNTVPVPSEAKILINMVPYIKDSLDKYVSEYIVKFNAVQKEVAAVVTDGFSAITGANDVHLAHAIKTPASKKKLLTDLFAKNPDAVLKSRSSFSSEAQTYLDSLEFENGVLPKSIGIVKKEVSSLFKAVMELKAHVMKYDNLLTSIGKSSMGKWAKFKSFPGLPESNYNSSAATILTMADPSPAAAAAPPAAAGPADPVKAGTLASAGTHFFTSSLEQVKKYYTDTSHVQDTLFDTAITDTAQFDVWKKFVRRRLAAELVEKARGNTFTSMIKVSAPQYVKDDGSFDASKAPASMDTPFDDGDWSKYVADIELEDKGGDLSNAAKFQQAFVGALYDPLQKAIPFEFDMWKPESSGQILFSEDSSKSFSFKDGNLAGTYGNINVASHGNPDTDLFALGLMLKAELSKL